MRISGESLTISITAWPTPISQLPSTLHGYHKARAHLSEADGLLLYDDRIVIPGSQRMESAVQAPRGSLRLDQEPGESQDVSVVAGHRTRTLPGSTEAAEKAVDHLRGTEDELQAAGHQQR
ncbi:hypothetical protein SRHO_G00294180 [Serrasalmus rhombeus]